MALQPAKTLTHLHKQGENTIFSESFSFSVKIFSLLDSEDSKACLLLTIDASLQQIRPFCVYPASLKEQILNKFPVTFDAKCHATSEHSECVAILGKAHAEAMLTETSCSGLV